MWSGGGFQEFQNFLKKLLINARKENFDSSLKYQKCHLYFKIYLFIYIFKFKSYKYIHVCTCIS